MFLYLPFILPITAVNRTFLLKRSDLQCVWPVLKSFFCTFLFLYKTCHINHVQKKRWIFASYNCDNPWALQTPMQRNFLKTHFWFVINNVYSPYSHFFTFSVFLLFYHKNLFLMQSIQIFSISFLFAFSY